MIGSRLIVRYPTPMPQAVWLGAVVRQNSIFGTVTAVVTGIYRAPDDEWQPPGVLIETSVLR